MNKKKAVNIIYVFVFCIIILNTLVSYFSYKEICDNKKPKIAINEVRKDDKIIYNLLLYKVIVYQKENIRTVNLKLFFLD